MVASQTGVAQRVTHEALALHRWFEVHAFRMGGPGSAVGVVFTNITEQKKAQAQWAELDQMLQDKNATLERAMAVADKASVAKSAFLSSMSHELRTPLNAILGFAQLLEISLPPPTVAQKRSVDQILKAGWYLLDLINEVLDLSTIESGKVMLSKEPVALAELLLECRTMIEPQAQKRGIAMRFPRLEKNCFVSADRTRFKQVILNLLLNAIKYNRPNGAVEITCTFAPSRVHISVRDTGAGMAPEQMAHLFQPFNRLGKESGIEEGTGIGLIVTKRLIELMGGEIGVESEVDVGSVFWLELDLASAPQISAVAHSFSDVPAQATPAVAIRTLLYVEDNSANLELVEQLIGMRSDMRLLSASDGSLGVDFARTYLPDVILMDINLPGISGIQALQILQADASTRNIPVIALSANAMPSDIAQGLAYGFFRYLTKPLRLNEFMTTLDAALVRAAENLQGST
jgi:signal transduction histidine kinase/CheY-like chemotaxis protein